MKNSYSIIILFLLLLSNCSSVDESIKNNDHSSNKVYVRSVITWDKEKLERQRFLRKNPEPIISGNSIISLDECKFDHKLSIIEFAKIFSIVKTPLKSKNPKRLPKYISTTEREKVYLQSYRFSKYGIKVNFDMDGVFKYVEFVEPFLGVIGGVKLGSTRDELLLIRGEPDQSNIIETVYMSNGLYSSYMTFGGKTISIIKMNRCI